jgi:hypothetical protein
MESKYEYPSANLLCLLKGIKNLDLIFLLSLIWNGILQERIETPICFEFFQFNDEKCFHVV